MALGNAAYAAPVQTFAPQNCAVLAVPGANHTAISPLPQWIMATVAGNISLDFGTGQLSLVIPFAAGVWVLMSPTAINLTGTSATGLWMMW